MAQSYNHITSEEFDQALSDILDTMTGGQILAIPSVYEAVSEELNNEALDYANNKFHEPNIT